MLYFSALTATVYLGHRKRIEFISISSAHTNSSFFSQPIKKDNVSHIPLYSNFSKLYFASMFHILFHIITPIPQNSNIIIIYSSMLKIKKILTYLLNSDKLYGYCTLDCEDIMSKGAVI